MHGRALGSFSRQGGAFPSFWIGQFIFLKKEQCRACPLEPSSPDRPLPNRRKALKNATTAPPTSVLMGSLELPFLRMQYVAAPFNPSVSSSSLSIHVALIVSDKVTSRWSALLEELGVVQTLLHACREDRLLLVLAQAQSNDRHGHFQVKRLRHR